MEWSRSHIGNMYIPDPSVVGWMEQEKRHTWIEKHNKHNTK